MCFVCTVLVEADMYFKDFVLPTYRPI